MNSNQEIVQPSATSFHRKSAKFLCRPCNRQFSCVNPENGRAACPRCDDYSTLIIENAQQAPIQASDLSTSQTTTQQSQSQSQPQSQSQSQSQSQQPRNAQFIRQTIYRPGQTIVIETISPEMQFGGQQTSQTSGFGFENLFGFGGLSSLFGGFGQPTNQTVNPSDLFGNSTEQPNQQGQQTFFGSPFGGMFFMPSPMMFFNGANYEQFVEEFLRNDPNNYGPAPASKENINKLKEFEYETGVCKNSDCSVCQDEYKSGDKCVVLPCEHNYHKDCVVEWLKRHDTCPVCRKSIATNKQENSNRMEEEIPQQQQGF